MAPGTDTKRPALPDAVVCDLVGCPAPTRQSWIRRGLLGATSGGCTLSDAFELFVLSKLLATLGPRDTGFVWPEIQGALREKLLVGHLVDLVVDVQRKDAIIVQDHDQLLAAIRTGRPTRVFQLADELAALRDDFQRLAERATTKTGRSARGSEVEHRQRQS